MDKISSILKPSPRIQSADLRDTGPVRSGTPAFGRPELPPASIRDAARELSEVNPMSTAKRATAIANDVNDWRSKDMKQAALAAELTNKFFAKPLPEVAPASVAEPIQMPALRAQSLTERASNPAGFKTDEMGHLGSFGRASAYETAEESEPMMLAQPEGLYPKGSFIDRVA